MESNEICKFCKSNLIPIDYRFKNGTTIIMFNYYCNICKKKVEIYFNHKTSFKTSYY